MSLTQYAPLDSVSDFGEELGNRIVRSCREHCERFPCNR
jgi:hypothetical protein